MRAVTTLFVAAGTLNGRSGDFNVAADGRLLLVEEATALDAIPAAARAAIQKKVGGGAVTTVEIIHPT